MKNKTRKVPFEIYLPATEAKEAKYIKTIEVETYLKNGNEFLTEESNTAIEIATANAMGSLHGSEIKALRKKLGVTQATLAEGVGCGKKTLSRWENGRGFPTSTYNKILRLLDAGLVTLAELNAIESPRKESSEDTSTFFANRPTNIYKHDFKRTSPPQRAVKDLLDDQKIANS